MKNLSSRKLILITLAAAAFSPLCIAQSKVAGDGRTRRSRPPAVSSTDRAPQTIREALLEITAAKLNPTPLSITYDDMHGLWGGLTLTIRGDGNVEQKAVKEKAGTPTVVSRDSILKLVRLLLKEKAWEQREQQ